MMPWGHFAVAFLPYLAYRLVGHRDLPSRRATCSCSWPVPDLIDKPLAWSLHLLPSGRLAGSLAVDRRPARRPVSVLAARRGRAELGPLFGFGYLTHVVGDVYRALLYTAPDQWAGTYVASLVWPLAPIPASETTAFLYYFLRVSPDALRPGRGRPRPVRPLLCRPGDPGRPRTAAALGTQPTTTSPSRPPTIGSTRTDGPPSQWFSRPGGRVTGRPSRAPDPPRDRNAKATD